MKPYEIVPEDQFLHLLNDFQVAYEAQNSARTIADELQRFIDDRLAMRQLIKAGLSYDLYQKIALFAPFTEAEWAELLGVSTKSLSRYQKNKTPFKPIHAEKIIEVAEVMLVGTEVFDSRDIFILWLRTPCFALGGECPIDFLQDSYGKEMVMAELTRIDHGILA